MELITKELERKFSNYPIYSQKSMMLDAKVIVKYFNPMGAGTWLVTEAEQLLDGDWKFLDICTFSNGSGAMYFYRNFKKSNSRLG